MLRCARCGKIKPEGFFRKTKTYPKRGYRHSWCIDCEKAYHRAYSEKWEKQHRTERLARQKTAKYKAKRKEWRDRTQYYEKNKQYWKDWYQNNKPVVRAKMDKWRAANLDKWNGYGRKRRAMLKGRLVEPYSGLEIYNRDRGICGICKLPIDLNLKHPDLMSFSIDHILPIALGGDDTPDNVQASHLGCNARKAHHV